MNVTRLKEIYPDLIWAGKKQVCGLPLSFTTYILTPTKLITRVGFLNLIEDEIELNRVRDISLLLPITQRIFGCGSIKVTSLDSDTSTKLIQSVYTPRKVKSLLTKYIAAEQDKYHVRGRDMYCTF